MKLYTREDSDFWYFSFTVNGKRYRGSTKRPLSDRKGAEAVLADLYQKAMNRRQLGLKDEITLSDMMDRTLNEVEGQTHRLYKAAKTQLCNFFGKDRLVSDIMQEDIDAFVAFRKGQGKANNTIRGDLKAFFRAWNRAKRTHHVNPDLEMPKIKPTKKTRYLSDMEEQRVLEILNAEAETNVTAEKARDLMILLIDTGVRLMEGVELDWTDIDTTNRVIEVYRPKTDTVSQVPMTDRVLAMLTRRSNYHTPFEKMEFAIRYLRRVIDDVCNQNPRVVKQRGKATVHSLRDTFATRLVNKGMNLHELAKLLGHTSTAMTEKYSHLENTQVVNKARDLMAG